MSGRAFHLMYEAAGDADGRPTRFVQLAVLYADSANEAKGRLTELLASRSEQLVRFDEEETREVDPATVGYANVDAIEGVVGITGRMWIVPAGPIGRAREWFRRTFIDR